MIPSLTPDNDILHQFKASSAAGGMIISIIIPRELIMIIKPLGMQLWDKMTRPVEGPWQKCPPRERLMLPEGCRRPKVEAARRQQEVLEGGHFCQEPESAM